LKIDIMGVHASFALLMCSLCGNSWLATGMNSDEDSELDIGMCENCKTEYQVVKDKATGGIRIEELKKN